MPMFRRKVLRGKCFFVINMYPSVYWATTVKESLLNSVSGAVDILN